MASKRNAKFLDAQNFLFEMRQSWLHSTELALRHEAESGKDTTYYFLLGRSDALLHAVEMAEDFAAGQYAVKYD